jgi:hypothetical protein
MGLINLFDNYMSKTMEHTKPSARKTGLVVKKLNSETLVYDVEKHQAHCLNQNAAFIWEHCDGKRSVDELADLFDNIDHLSADQRQQIVWIVLAELSKSHLLEKPIEKTQTPQGLSRRQLMKVAGIAALIAIPAVTTIIAPTAAHASTCLPSGQGCTTSAQCCSGLCSGGVCA